MSYLKLLSVKQRLLTIFTGLVVLLVCTNLYSYFTLTTLGNKIDSISQDDIPLMIKLNETGEARLQQDILLEKLLRHGERSAMSLRHKQVFLAEIEKYFEYNDKVSEKMNDTITFINNTAENSSNADLKKKFSELEKELNTISTQYQTYIALGKTVISAIETGTSKESNIVQLESRAENINDGLKTLLKDIEAYTSGAVEEAIVQEKEGVWILAIVTIFGVIMGFGLAFPIILSLIKDINNAVDLSKSITEQVTTNTYSERINFIKQSDEIGTLFKAFETLYVEVRTALVVQQKSLFT